MPNLRFEIMKRLTVALPEGVEVEGVPSGTETIETDSVFSGAAVRALLDAWKSEYLMLALPGGKVELGARSVERFVQIAGENFC